jgi:hypothetical protein
MKHLLNNLTEEEKNAIREQHTGGMKVMTENFSKLINSKLGDSKPLVAEQYSDMDSNVRSGKTVGAMVGAGVGSIVPGVGTAVGAGVGYVAGGLIAAASAIANGVGSSDQKVKQFCDLCKKSQSPITQKSNQLADMVRDSVQGAGTDEQKIFNAFKGITTFDEFCSLIKSYQQSYNTDLYADLNDDIDSESEWVLIFRPLRDVLLRQQQTAKPTTGVPQKPGMKPTANAQAKPLPSKVRQ